MTALAAGGAHARAPFRVGLVLEQPLVGRIDDPFQHGAYVGLLRATQRLHVEGRLVAPKPSTGYEPTIAYLARQSYDLVIGIGGLESAAIDAEAIAFPQVRFGILDATLAELPHHPRNVVGTLFRTEQAAYLAGYLGARMIANTPRPHVVSAVGGSPIPAVRRFIAGFQAGARRADPRVHVLTAYSDDFIDETKCHAAAADQIANGSRVVFDVAGGCGLGALAAAKESGVWGIGVDIDQSFLGSFVLTSVVKHLDVAVFGFARALTDGTLRTGRDVVFDLRNGGVALGRISPRVPPRLRREVDRLRARIVAGRVEIPTDVK